MDIHKSYYDHLEVSWNGGTSMHIHSDHIFHCKPSSYGGTPIYGTLHMIYPCRFPSFTTKAPRRPCTSAPAAARRGAGCRGSSAAVGRPNRWRGPPMGVGAPGGPGFPGMGVPQELDGFVREHPIQMDDGGGGWGPIAKMPCFTGSILWFMVDITIVHGVYKPTYSWGTPSWSELCI